MALGGGTFISQNKTLPGSYINFVSAANASAALSERGTAAMPVFLDWGNDGEVFTVTADEFQTNSLKIFGYQYTDKKLRPLRELFANAGKCHLYKINSGGAKASGTFATAKYTGEAGNKISIVITANENSTTAKPLYDVETLFDGECVDEQKAVSAISELSDNDYVVWNKSAQAALTSGSPLTGGTSGTASAANYQTFLNKIESYSFNILALDSTDSVLKQLFANFTKRMRDNLGIKFQCVLHGYTDADCEGVISVENKVKDFVGQNEICINDQRLSSLTTVKAGDYVKNTDNGYAVCTKTDSGAMLVVRDETQALVYWTAGKQAACAVNKCLTNTEYTGEYTVDTDYTQTQLENGINAGKFMLHKVGDKVRVLEDINTLTSFTDEKGKDFASNQTVRVMDQVGNDIATLFNTKYLGVVPNDNAGRISLWNDIVTHHKQLEELRAIQNFEPSEVTVEQGSDRKAVVITDCIMPVSAMSRLYMTVIVQ